MTVMRMELDIYIIIIFGIYTRGRGFDSQPEGLGVAFFATGPGLGLIMYMLSTLEFPTHNLKFHLLDIYMRVQV